MTGLLMKVHDALQRGIEKLFFHGKSNPLARRIAFSIENVILMLILFYFILNTLLYNWTGALYPEGSGFRLDRVFGGLDNAIPFVPEMAVFYVFLFYSVTVISMLYFAFIDAEKGYALGWVLVIINFVAIIIYIFFPVSTQWYRADLLAHPLPNNPLAQVMYNYYATDTSFNCFPSLHAAVSTAIAYTWFRYARLIRSVSAVVVAIVAIIIAAGVILSTLFVRQHYIADEIAGIILALVTGKLVVDRLWKKTAQA
jgi:membrane-associated phospholipid phosphatase